MSRPVFPGRVVFDHLPKTAGTAINAWLLESLGTGCVTSNLRGKHREIIKEFGGAYSVISAHLTFLGEGLDPRYRYVCCVRDPIDRAVSWLYFIVKDHDKSQLPGLWEEMKELLDSEGELTGPSLGHIQNFYVEHFASIASAPGASEAEKLEKAVAIIDRYDVWGLYERLPEFLADFAAMVGLEEPKNIAKVRVTRDRPALEDVSPKLSNRLRELNALDMEFYSILRGRYMQSRKRWYRAGVTTSEWARFERSALTVGDATGKMCCEEVVGDLVVGEMISLGVRITNDSAEDWVGDLMHPINLSYRWLDQAGNIAVTNGERTAFPKNVLRAGASSTLRMGVKAPEHPGRYRLRAMPVQELVCWFDERGFAPLEFAITVVAPDHARHFPAQDVRLFSSVGRIVSQSRVTNNEEGLLLRGPHLALPAGTWRAVLSGHFRTTMGAFASRFTQWIRNQHDPFTFERTGIVVEVASGQKDGQVLAKHEVTGTRKSLCLEFELKTAATDLEVRVWVDEAAQARIHSLRIEPVHHGNWH